MYRAPTLQKPSREAVAELSEQLQLNIPHSEIEDYHEIISGLLDKYAVLEKYPEPKLPVKYPRTPGYRPPTDENKYNAWYYKTDIQGAPSGLLHGKTVAVKDCFPVAGVPMMNGSRVLEGYVPDYDATIVTRLLDAGACIKGKAVCEDMCWSICSFNSANGPVLNPHDVTRDAGGSSSGCAALVACGEVDMAIGSDQGGSVRVPASMCGIVGLRPTFGLVPYTGIAALNHSLDTAGPMARTVHDCALILEAIAGYDDGLDPRQTRGEFHVPKYTEQLTGKISGKKVAMVTEGFNGCEPDVAHLVRQAACRLTTSGADVKEISIPIHTDAYPLGLPVVVEGIYHSMIVGSGHQVGPPAHYATSAIEAMHAFGKARRRDLSPSMKVGAILGQHMMENYGLRFYAKSQNMRRMVKDIFDEALKEYDVLVMPTVKFKAPVLPPESLSIKEMFQRQAPGTFNTRIFSTTGHPALSINAGFSEGLPVGMMFVGRHFEEDTVLNVAYAYEKIRDTEK